MRKLLLIPLLLVIGCASLENNAYHTIGSVTTLVDASMQAWAEYANSGAASWEQIDAVHNAYDKYFTSVQAVRAAVLEYKQNEGSDQTALQKAIKSVAAASGDLIGLIGQFLPPEKAAKLKGVR